MCGSKQLADVYDDGLKPCSLALVRLRCMRVSVNAYAQLIGIAKMCQYSSVKKQTSFTARIRIQCKPGCRLWPLQLAAQPQTR